MSQPYLSFLSAHAGRRARSALDARHRVGLHTLPAWLNVLVVLVQVMASFSAAATGAIQPAALAPLVGSPRTAQAAAPSKVASAKPPAIKSANAAPVNKPAFAAISTQSTITGVVFHDVNGNGVNDSEPGINGVTVTALCATDTGPDNILGGRTGNSQDDVYATYTATTASTGAYAFTNVAGWPCRIFFATPSGYFPGPHGLDSQGAMVLAPSVDDNGNPAAGAGNLSLPPATFTKTVNYGLVQTGDTTAVEFSGYLWADGDNDGVIEPGEPAWAGTPVKLFAPGADPLTATPVATVQTGADGRFYFSSRAGTDTTSDKFGLTLSANTAGYNIIYDVSSIPSFGVTSTGRGEDRCFSSSGVLISQTSPRLIEVSAASPALGLSPCNNAGLGHSSNYQYDFGDAPDSYHTSAAHSGAYEAVDINSNVRFLGPCITTDASNHAHDGAPFDVDFSAALPSINADGDDKHSAIAGCSQDDGVTFSPMVPGQDMVITLTAPSRYTSLYLNAWFDWNGNGVFDSNERVIDGGFAGTGCDLSADGGNTRPGALNFYDFATTPVTRIIHVPSNVTLASGAPGVYSRFRVNSTCYTTPPDGPGPNGFGEVEDYVTPVPSLMGAIKLVKQTTGGDGIFAFTSSNASLDQSITTVGGTGSSSVILLTAGIYTVTENALSGWNTTGINITGDTNNNSTTSVGSRQAVIHLDAGENTTVTFANNKVTTSGQLIVRKAAPVVTNCVALNHSDTTDPNAGNNAACVGLTVVPTNAVGVNFNFTDNVLMANGVLTPTFALQMGQAITFTSVVSGAYIVTETQQAGWQLANASCSNGDAPQHVSVPTGATVTCTFTNTQATAQFGDRVWLESDHDGLASTGALTPVAGLRITATASSGQVYTATTNAAGYYSFTVPANVTYTVQYGAAPASYGVVMPSSTPGGNHESGNAGSYQASGNPDQAHSQATTVFLQAGEANWHVDFAFTPVLVSLGNLVWYDTNNNGQVDTGEYGISGVKVSLYQDANSDGAYTPGVDTFITTTTTSASGYYSFTNLAPSSSLSTRYLVVIAGANFVSGGTLAYYQSSTGSVSASNTTNSQDNGVDGTLNTSGLGGYIASRAIDLTVGAQPTNDGDTSTSNPLTAAVGVADTLPNPSNTNWTVDFGFYKLTLGNQLWYDQNNNGLYEPANGETGLSGVPVALLSGGTVVLTTTTDAQGVYTFTGLISGTYQVRITAPTGLVSTQDTANSSATSNVDSNDKGPGVAGGVITSQNFRLTPGNQSGAVTVSNSTGATVNPTLDFGLIQFVKLGNRLWIESDNDGDATTGTVTPVIGQVVTATSNSGQVYTATTDANGLYTITVLANATYTVTTGTPAGTVASTVITNVANDSNAAAKNDKNHLNTGTTVTVVTTDNLSVDFGFHALAAQFGDRVWLESDTDGLANTGSITPVVGLVITATNSSSGVVYTATTDAQGYYSFTAPAGTYTVHYGRVPASYGAVIPSATPGGNRESGNAGSYQQSSNPDQSHVNGTTVTVAAGEANWHIDFAFWLPQPKIHLTKYTNGDDADLPTGPTVGVGSVVTWTYAITNTGNVTLTNVKLVDDQEGSVTCPQAQLAPGSAMTCILTGTAKAGQYANTAVVTGTPTLGPVTPVTSTNPSHYLGLTAGLGDRVWYDANHNGVQDLGENGVPNVTVQLLNNSGAVIRTTTTGATGYYSFTNLTPGVYAVRFVTSTLPAGYQLTTLNSGSDKTADSDANVNTGKTTSIPLVANQYDPTWDAGIWLPQPSILLKKYTNGYDADTVTGPYLAVGQVVTWTYTLTNTGNVTLTNITLRDNVEGRVTCTPTTLAPGAGTSCTQTGIAQAGQYSNTAVVTGTPTLGPVTPVTSTNPSHYFGAKPDVVLKKYTNGYDADTLSDARPHLHLGDPVTWTYIITNTGNVPLRFAANSLKDDKEGVIPHAAFTLLPGESQTLTQHGFATTVGVYTNIGSIPAIPVMPPPSTPDIPTFPPSNPPSTPITPTNPSHYDAVSAPAIVLKKYTNGYDADTITGPYLSVGSVVTWTYVITNIGNVTLTNVTLTDDKLGGVTCPVTTLAPNATTTCTTTGIAGVGQYTNTALVTGTNSLTPTQKVTSTNPSHYFGAKPDVVLKKYTNGYDADTLSDARPHLHLGDPVTWTYVITNTGNVPLRFAANSLKDDKEGVIPHAAFTLLPGESQTLTQHGFATTVGVYTNIGSIPAIPVMPPPSTPDIPTFPPSNPPSTPMTPTNPSHYDAMGLSLGNRVWVDNGAGSAANRNNGRYDAGEPAAPQGIVVELLDITGTVLFTTTTDSHGYYRFDNLAVGSYQVRIPASEFALGGKLSSYASSTGQDTAFAATDNNHDHGDDAELNGVKSAVVTLGASNPTGDVDSGATGVGDNGPSGDANDNLTVDFGFVPQASFGNFVWIESDNDGKASTGTITPVGGMVITATDSTGTVYTATTDTNGYYTFSVPADVYTVTYGRVPSAYGAVVPSATPNSGMADKNNLGTDQQSRPNHTVVTLVAGDNIPTIDFGFHAPRADLRLVKQANKTRVQSGDTLVYTLVLTNDGPDDASGVKVDDLLPSDVTYQNSVAQQGTYDQNTGIWDVGTVVANSSVTLTITVTVK